MKKTGFILNFLLLAFVSRAQPPDCTFNLPALTIDFGSGFISDPNTTSLYNYRRVAGFCPSDGHYAFAPFTERCFSDDWHTLSSDHTGGDGNMLIVNAAPDGGVFLAVPVDGLKGNTTYELSLWLINLCRPTKKCPYLLLPSLNIRLVTQDGKVVANIVTQELPRVQQPTWSRHKVYLTTPATTENLQLVMADNAPGGCGNDFALDDIVFRECIKKIVAPPVKTQPAKKVTAANPVKKKTTAPPQKKTFDTGIKTKTGYHFKNNRCCKTTRKNNCADSGNFKDQGQ